MRHNYLAATFGTKPEEDRSYENSHKLMIATTVCMISFLVLEIAFYFLYNRKVKAKCHLKTHINLASYSSTPG